VQGIQCLVPDMHRDLRETWMNVAFDISIELDYGTSISKEEEIIVWTGKSFTDMIEAKILVWT